MAQILTLCAACRDLLNDRFRCSPIATNTTTEKKTVCENCRRKLGQEDLKQYTVTARR